jgi:hypothetical protein
MTAYPWKIVGKRPISILGCRTIADSVEQQFIACNWWMVQNAKFAYMDRLEEEFKSAGYNVTVRSLEEVTIIDGPVPTEEKVMAIINSVDLSEIVQETTKKKKFWRFW